MAKNPYKCRTMSEAGFCRRISGVKIDPKTGEPVFKITRGRKASAKTRKMRHDRSSFTEGAQGY